MVQKEVTMMGGGAGESKGCVGECGASAQSMATGLTNAGPMFSTVRLRSSVVKASSTTSS